LILRGGTVIDETGERMADVVVVDGVISEIGPHLAAPAGATILDAEGAVIAPGLVDLHVHLREPGLEESETIETGARGAALGGFTAVVAMPNTDPPLDDAALVQSVLERGRGSVCDVHVAGCITKGRAGVELAPLGEMYDLGVRVFTDDGACVADAAVMRHAFEYSLALPGAVMSQHAEDLSLAASGHLNEGEWSSLLGMVGRPAVAEETIVARDLALARTTGARYHVQHLSTAGAADLVRRAKSDGVRVSAECTPHHLVLTDEACRSFDPVFKVNPPLRARPDVEALIDALADGTVDAIATDHAPHAAESKAVSFEEAPPGVVGLETALAVAITHLVSPERMTLAGAIGALSWRPARLAGLAEHGRPLVPGRQANICVIDADERWRVDVTQMASRSRNSPFDGWEMVGRVRHTVLRGEPVVVDGRAQR